MLIEVIFNKMLLMLVRVDKSFELSSPHANHVEKKQEQHTEMFFDLMSLSLGRYDLSVPSLSFNERSVLRWDILLLTTLLGVQNNHGHVLNIYQMSNCLLC